MTWIKDVIDPKSRQWEEFYRRRWQHDKVIRSTHGVNCTGGCSWNIYVKDGIITWEMQATDYPLLDTSVPPYEPRGCQRGISASWYIYSPLRIKYPYIRGKLLELWKEAKKQYSDPVKAWESIVSDKEKRSSYQKRRGLGGFRRTTWEESIEIIAASMIYTAKKYGPDRVFGFSPIPAMSYLSYAGGSRLMQLFGGVVMSFYDWYSDLPPASPEVWGEQTDVAESADWFNAKYIVSMGSNLSVTRAPDAHFIHEARHNGTKFVVISPDFSAVAKNSDWWIPVRAGQDTALWMAANHVILKEFHVDKQVPYFMEYIKRYSDAPFLVKLEKGENGLKTGQFLRCEDIDKLKDEENAYWKPVVFDGIKNEIVVPQGTIGHRWSEEKGKWNLELKEAREGREIDPVLTFIESKDDVAMIEFVDYASGKTFLRGVPVKTVETTEGTIQVATVYDLLLAQFAVPRGLPGDYPESYDDAVPYTPAWQEEFTGIGRDTVIRFAREFAHNAEVTEGKSMILIGTGINHWYYNNLGYRAPITALIMTGSVGKNGGGLNHYVGQEKVSLLAPWVTVAMAFDWQRPPRLQQTPIWHYMHSDQWRYEGAFTDYASLPKDSKYQGKHVADLIAKAVKRGWMPFYPQFNRNTLDLLKEAKESGAKTKEEIQKWLVERLKNKEFRFAVEDVDAEENWPRVFVIWRANALMSSAKCHEYFLRHYLGAKDNLISEERAKGVVEHVEFREPAPRAKMDLVVDLNFRMDTSALYSDIVLPAAMWYEKNDMNTTDLHTFVHPLGQAVPPSWEAKSDWDIFKTLAKKISELAPKHFPEPLDDVIAAPLLHDTPAELAQKDVKDWFEGECEPIPGKTMPNLAIVQRDYTKIYNKFISFGRAARDLGMGVHGIKIPIKDFYDALLENPIGGSPDPKHMRCVEWDGQKYPSLEDALDAANTILYFAPETNGDIAYAAFKEEEKKVGLPLADLAEENRSYRVTFEDITTQPRRIITSPGWSGIINKGRPYAAYTINVERHVPWRTLTGRQSLYIDHPYYKEFGEQLPTYKPKLDIKALGELRKSVEEGKALVLNFATPHGKWQIHSTFYDNHRMRTLSRSVEPLWMHPDDADKLGIKDNDWVEIYNDNGVVVIRANVSRRMQPGMVVMHHSAERTLSIPKSPTRGNRAGVHNSLIRARLNPLFLAGGYAQFTYFFNYWGPTGVNRDTYVIVRKLDKVEF